MSTTKQTTEHVVAFHKDALITIQDHRPITVLNTVYIILARVAANSVQSTLSAYLNSEQQSGAPGRPTIYATAGLRDGLRMENCQMQPSAFYLCTSLNP